MMCSCSRDEVQGSGRDLLLHMSYLGCKGRHILGFEQVQMHAIEATGRGVDWFGFGILENRAKRKGEGLRPIILGC